MSGKIAWFLAGAAVAYVVMKKRSVAASFGVGAEASGDDPSKSTPGEAFEPNKLPNVGIDEPGYDCGCGCAGGGGCG